MIPLWINPFSRLIVFLVPRNFTKLNRTRLEVKGRVTVGTSSVKCEDHVHEYDLLRFVWSERFLLPTNKTDRPSRSLLVELPWKSGLNLSRSPVGLTQTIFTNLSVHKINVNGPWHIVNPFYYLIGFSNPPFSLLTLRKPLFLKLFKTVLGPLDLPVHVGILISISSFLWALSGFENKD